MVKSPRSAEGLEHFSIERFLEDGLARSRGTRLVAKIETHEDFMYIYPDQDDATVYRFPSDAVRIISESYSIVDQTGRPQKYHMRSKSAPLVLKCNPDMLKNF